MNNIQKYITISLFIISLAVIFNSSKMNVYASKCPRYECPNKCDLTGSECIANSPCTTSDQGWWCISKISCDSSLQGGVRQRALQCDGTKWVDFGVEEPSSDCAGFCKNENPPAPSPTPYPPGAQACKDRPFRVEFKSTRKLGPGENVVCKVSQVDTLCEPCTGLKKDTQCSFGTSFDTCSTVDSDCLCKYNGGFAYTCELNGIPFVGGSGTLPPAVVSNASTANVTFTPPSGSALECGVNNVCNNCNGNDNQCYPDCGGGMCDSGTRRCIQCPANQPVCQIGQSCTGKCNGNDAECYPGCNGGICNAKGTCDTCAATGVTPILPTQTQQKSVITIAPTFKPAGNSGPAATTTQRWFCLETQPCSDPFSECSGQGDSKHRVSLTTGDAAKAIPNRDTYLFECLTDSVNGMQCTSGSSAVDTQILQTDMLSKLTGYNFVGFYEKDGVTAASNPLRSNSKGEIGVHEWESTSNTTGHVFFAMNPVNPEEFSGNRRSSQQSTFNMEEVPYTNCLMLTYDPYGRVFDSQTLEPIAGAKVTVLKKNTDGSFVPVKSTDVIGGITNPVVTKMDGSFSFRVPDGTYKIAVESKGYSFPARKNSLNKKYNDAYSNIYFGEEIVQKGKIVHHDVPLSPDDPKKSQLQSANTKPQIISVNHSLNKTDKTIIVEGVASHPRAMVEIYGKKPSGGTFIRTRMLKNAQADKQGIFKIVVKESSLGTGEVVGDIIVKKDSRIYTLETKKKNSWLTSLSSMMSSLVQKVLGSEKELQSVVSLEPIPDSLYGYAYNEKGVAVPNTKVEVYLPFSKSPIVYIKTDEYGYFNIASKYLPDIPYHLEYKTTSGKKISKSVSQFILDNSHN